MDDRGLTRRGIVAVDGPAGAGKSTVARLLATHLGYLYLDTGAMYRALAYKALKYGIDLRDDDSLADLLKDTEIVLQGQEAVHVRLDNRDVTDELRTPAVNASVSQVAGLKTVRTEMVKRQRRMAENGGVVMDGRDIGTFVLPEADVKFYLTASLKARSQRRFDELARQGYPVEFSRIQEEISHRDLLDKNRNLAPLAQAHDAIRIDSTDMEVEDVLARMLAVCRQRLL